MDLNIQTKFSFIKIVCGVSLNALNVLEQKIQNFYPKVGK